MSLYSYAQELNPGDGVRISFLDIEDVITGDYYIQPNGLINLPLIGIVNTSNKNFNEIKSEIEFRYDSLYKDPHLSVNALFRINILGEVRNPGFYYVSDSEKFTAILALAGGTTGTADLDNIKLIRNFKEIDIDVEDIIKEGSTTTDFGLQSGDEIFVPRNWWADNSVWISIAIMAAMSSNDSKKEKSLVEVLHIVYRRKTIIILFTLVFLILALLYNLFSTPVFESTALIKKENPESRKNELYELVRLQTMDRLDTEIQLIQTEDVLSRVIDELNLRVELKEIIDPAGNSYELNNVFVDFPDSGNNYANQIGFSLPIFKNVKLKDKRTDIELYIEKKGENLFELRKVEENKLIADASPVSVIDTTSDSSFINNEDSIIALKKQSAGSIFKTDFAQFEFNWNDAPLGSKIYFNFNNYYEFLKGFRKTIYITGVGMTNMFRSPR